MKPDGASNYLAALVCFSFLDNTSKGEKRAIAKENYQESLGKM